MKTISARELRNDYARVLREVQDAGESWTITSNGRPVARITPIAPVPERLRPFSGIPLTAAAGANAAAGPPDHSELARQVELLLDPAAHDPYAGRVDEQGTGEEEEVPGDAVSPESEGGAPRRAARSGPGLGEIADRVAGERSDRR